MNLDRENILTLKEKHRNGLPQVTATPETMQSQRDKIERDTAEFLAKGGKIQEVGITKPYEHEATYSISRKRWAD